MIRLVILVVSLSLISGCACFPGNKLEKVTSLPSLPEGSIKPTFSYTFSYKAFPNTLRKFNTNRISFISEVEFYNVLVESGYVASMVSEKGNVNIEVDLEVTAPPFSWIKFVFIDTPNILTCSIYPGWNTNTFTAIAKVKAWDGKEHKYRLEDSVTVIAWVPLIVVPCFSCVTWGMDVPGAARKNIWRNLILKMYQDGIFLQHISIGP